jgi:anti-sigma regulatory factor (Ser/Thr protein kinase)
MPTAQLQLPPEPESVGIARRMLRDQLIDWRIDGLEFAASQALTELATNAVIHARTDFTVTVEWSEDVLRVCVHDRSPKLPVQRTYALDATTGRGLALVARLCRSWGVERDGTGKQVWFEVSAGAGVGDDDVEPDLDAEALLDAFADDEGDIAVSGSDGRALLAWAA